MNKKKINWNSPWWLFLLLLEPILVTTAGMVGNKWGWGAVVGMCISLITVFGIAYGFKEGKISMIISSFVINIIYWFGIFGQIKAAGL